MFVFGCGIARWKLKLTEEKCVDIRFIKRRSLFYDSMLVDATLGEGGCLSVMRDEDEVANGKIQLAPTLLSQDRVSFF